MNFFRLQFIWSGAEEGTGFRAKLRQTCPACGAHFVTTTDKFVTPEDEVEAASISLWDDQPPVPLFEAARLLIATLDLATVLEDRGMTGFDVRPVTIESVDGEVCDDEAYRWLRVTGRCTTIDAWDRIVSTCAVCGTARSVPVDRVVRSVQLKLPPPTADVSRARERTVGLIVSQRFVDVLDAHTAGGIGQYQVQRLDYVE
ncbi:MAG TPA: hypothetical protein VF796_02320 [Humisphaera sp.]